MSSVSNPLAALPTTSSPKGIEKKVKTLYPEMNLLSLDFDSGVSDVNVTNRLLLFVENIKTSKAPAPRKRRHKKEEAFQGEIML